MKQPKNSILVTYKTDKKGRPDLLSMKCYHNKRGLISPFKKRAYIDLTPFTVPVSLKSALTADNYRFTDMSDEEGYFAEYDREQIRKAIEHAKSEIEKEKKKYSPD